MEREDRDIVVLDPGTSISTCGSIVPYVAHELERLSFLPDRVDLAVVWSNLMLGGIRTTRVAGSGAAIRIRRSTHGPTGAVEDLAARFARLVAEWKDATAHLSSTRERAMHRAYQEIVGMGTEAVPLLLRELEREPDHWFWALRSITRENPVGPEHQGRLAEMARDWLEWGRSRGIVW